MEFMNNIGVPGRELKLAAESLVASALFLLCLSCAGGPAQNKAKLPIGYVDAPKTGAAVGGSFNAVGWALSEDGIDSISVYIDRTYFTSTSPNIERPDVLKVFPALGEQKNAGWNLAVDLGAVSSGLH